MNKNRNKELNFKNSWTQKQSKPQMVIEPMTLHSGLLKLEVATCYSFNFACNSEISLDFPKRVGVVTRFSHILLKSLLKHWSMIARHNTWEGIKTHTDGNIYCFITRAWFRHSKSQTKEEIRINESDKFNWKGRHYDRTSSKDLRSTSTAGNVFRWVNTWIDDWAYHDK